MSQKENHLDKTALLESEDAAGVEKTAVVCEEASAEGGKNASSAQGKKAGSAFGKSSDNPDVTCRIISTSEILQAGKRHGKKKADVASAKASAETAAPVATTSVFGNMLDYIHHKVFSEEKKREITHSQTSVNLGAVVSPEAGEAKKAEDKIPVLEQKYDVLRQFAGGGQGVLSQARDKILKRTVALKSLRQEYLSNPTVRQAFVNEAIITGQLEHPAIVSVYDLLKDNQNGIHLTMKLVRGQNMDELLHADQAEFRNGRISRWGYQPTLNYHIELFLRVCEAMGYAHSRGVLHCDLKPENIMLGEYGEIYVMDWGIAKKMNREGLYVLPKGQALDGTPRFIPPECFAGMPRGAQSDIYALGMILYEIVTLQRPFESREVKDLIREIKSGKRKPVVNQFGVPLSATLVAIVNKALDLDLEKRYQSVTDLESDLRNYLAHEPVMALPDTPLMKLDRFLSHHIQPLVAVTLLGLLVAFLMAMHNLQLTVRQAEQEQRASEEKMQIMRNMKNRVMIDQWETWMLDNVVHASISLSNQMTRIADKLNAETQFMNIFLGNSDWKGLPEIPIRNYRDYHGKLEGVRGSTPSQWYYQAFINPDIASYQVPPFSPAEKYEPQLKFLAPIALRLRNVVLESRGDRLTRQNLDSLKQKMLHDGTLIRRAFVGWDDTALQVAYPFQPEYEDTYVNRKRSWYVTTKNAWDKEGKRDVVWGKPYRDAGGGRYLLCCSQVILDDKDNFLGVMAFDVHFEFLLNILLNDGNGERFGTMEKYLVDRKGNTLCCIDTAMLRNTPFEMADEFELFAMETGDYLEGEDRPQQENAEENKEQLAQRYAELEQQRRERRAKQSQTAAVLEDASSFLDGKRELSKEVYWNILAQKGGLSGYYNAVDNGEEVVYLYAFLPNSELCIVEKVNLEVVKMRLGVVDLKSLWDF
ncbi:MAG: serine/threonine protein kinase [Lentisphaeria bacterium]|nr:serine/threonine protein kinase [Lentisphaeria bacterium]